MKYKVTVDIAPRTIPGTNGCHKYVFDYYRTKREAAKVADTINSTPGAGTANVEKK